MEYSTDSINHLWRSTCMSMPSADQDQGVGAVKWNSIVILKTLKWCAWRTFTTSNSNGKDKQNQGKAYIVGYEFIPITQQLRRKIARNRLIDWITFNPFSIKPLKIITKINGT